jgi:hypothetical protein
MPHIDDSDRSPIVIGDSSSKQEQKDTPANFCCKAPYFITDEAWKGTPKKL